MLRKAGESDQVATMTGRIVALDRARTFITLLVVIHHSVVNFTHFGNGDRMRWLGFDLVVLFNDSFFMAFMFLISGLFVHDSLTRNGAADSCAAAPGDSGYRLLVSIFVLIPIAYYAFVPALSLPGTTDFNYFHYWGRMITTGPWPSGQSWFLWVLLVFDVIAAAIWITAPKILGAFGSLIVALRTGRGRPLRPSSPSRSSSYLPMHLWSATAPGSSRAITRFQSRPAASCSIRPISSPVSASASSA